jgi:undecaprenyl-diphosphatase
MNSAVVYGALLLALMPALVGRWRRVAVALTALLVLLIGCSRLLLGVHFFTDVVGGYISGWPGSQPPPPPSPSGGRTA